MLLTSTGRLDDINRARKGEGVRPRPKTFKAPVCLDGAVVDTVEIEILGLVTAKASGGNGIVALTAVVLVFLAYRLSVTWLHRRRR